ncbi:MAG: hypothetical protein ACQEWV_29635 [Bacillota bacterium]
MIYYLFSEKERMELEELLINEMTGVKELLNKVEVTERREMIKVRALMERRAILLSLFYKISNNKEKNLDL